MDLPPAEARRRITLPVLRRVRKRTAALVEAIGVRRFGYAFDGPPAEWCQSEVPGLVLPTVRGDPASPRRAFTGCAKFAACTLIPDAVKWTAWADLTGAQRDLLRNRRCYRAAGDGVVASWDTAAIPARGGGTPRTEWIANPFGVRTSSLDVLARRARHDHANASPSHRDLSPCPVGGCVTPEMMRDYAAHSPAADPAADPKTYWETNQACPFYYRFQDSDLSVAARNPLRHAQCLLTLPRARSVFSRLGVVVAAPVFRSTRVSRLGGESIWYPYYAGYALLQTLGRTPTRGDSGYLDATLPLRWQLTAQARQQLDRASAELPILRVFESAEQGTHLTEWEARNRFVSVPDGQATTFLLTWVLMRRLMGVLADQAIGSVAVDVEGALRTGIGRVAAGPPPLPPDADLYPLTTWPFARPASPQARQIGAMLRLGYTFADDLPLHLIAAGDGFDRKASLADDLRLLGLLDSDDRPTTRVEACVRWLRAVGRTPAHPAHAPGGLAELLRPALATIDAPAFTPNDDARLPALCDALLSATLTSAGLAGGTTRRVPVADAASALTTLEQFERDRFRGASRLVPEIHAIVRAFWTTPLRWMFVPTASDVAEQPRPVTRGTPSYGSQVHSGIVLMLEDSFQSHDYDPLLPDARDDVLLRLKAVLPLLTTVGTIEEQHVRDEFIAVQQRWEGERAYTEHIDHMLKTVQDRVADAGKPTTGVAADPARVARAVCGVLDMLRTHFLSLPATGAVRSASARPALVDVSAVARAAVEVHAGLSAGDHGPARVVSDDGPVWATIYPIEESYTDEDGDKIAARAARGLRLMLLEAMLQRPPWCRLEVSVTGDEGRGVLLTLRTVGTRSNFEWDSSAQKAELPRGRGFRTSVGASRLLGSIDQRFRNEGSDFVLRWWFEQGD